MTELTQPPRTAEAAATVVTEFFDRYRAHDVEGMTDLCSMNADFYDDRSSCGAERGARRRQGPHRGRPAVDPADRLVPGSVIAVQSITSNDDGDEVRPGDIEGTAPLPWGLIGPAGRHYREPHLFIFHVRSDLLMNSVTAYWNDADIAQQLGRNEVD